MPVTTDQKRIDPSQLVASGIRTISIENESVAALAERIDDAFVRACELILNCKGRVVVTGMGKSGHVGNKIAATLASTGTPAFFVHPAEASHGDMGMITRTDVVIAISHSGSTAEVVALIPLVKRLGIPLIAMAGNTQSSLAARSDALLNIGVQAEACPLDLAPTSSTTATLVMGDALAIALLEARGFTAEDFAFSHPGGALGRKLLLKVSDIMHQDEDLPRVSESTPLKLALLEMTSKGFGMTTVVSESAELLGVFTDGDLRRTIDQKIDLDEAVIGDIMSRNPRTVSEDTLAAEALQIMEEMRITAVIVTDIEGHPRGVAHMHDLLRAGVM